MYLGYVFILTHQGASVALAITTGSGTQFRGGDSVPGAGKNYHDLIKMLIDLRKIKVLNCSALAVKESNTNLYLC